MKNKIKVLLCEDDILQQLMAIPITEILSYSSKSDSVDPEEALRYLADMYIDNCGVSEGLRSFADYCAVFWIEKLKQKGDKEFIAKYGEAETLPELLPLLSDNYTKEIDSYDITFMSSVDLRDILVDELNDAVDEKIKIIICAGICSFLPLLSNDDRWLNSYKMSTIEDAIVNLKSETLIRYRSDKNTAKYSLPYKIPPTITKISDELREIVEKPPHPFSDEEIHHFEMLDTRLVELQHEVMEQVRAITLNLQEQIANGFHQYESFHVEGHICVDDIEGDVDSLLNILCDHANYTVIISNSSKTREDLDREINDDMHWYGNWSGIFHQLESEHGMKVCRAFCKIFEEASVFTIDDIMKITPGMLYSTIKIYI